MGREIRRVPPNWKHPRHTEDTANRREMIGNYIPMVDQDYPTASSEWINNFLLWMKGEHPDQSKDWCSDYANYWEYDSPPDEEWHRPAFTEKPTWFQMYETVSDGTPVTPPFGQKSSLVNWLVEKGESHGTRYEQRYSRSQAEAFVEQEWALSMIITPEHGVQTGVEACETLPS